MKTNCELNPTTDSDKGYFLADHLGSTNGLTNSSGTLTDATSYDSFGNATNPGMGTRYQYTGREFDWFTGLQYNRARFYDPEIGRFISEDPIGFNGGDVNLYGYVGNNATNFTDPQGTDCNGSRRGRGRCVDLFPKGTGSEPDRPPYTRIIDPPTPTPTPFSPPSTPASPSTPPATPSGPATPCSCSLPRSPDFYSVAAYFPLPITGGIGGIGGSISIDRYGQGYYHPGLNFGLPSGGGASVVGGYLLQICEPTPSDLEKYMTGPGSAYSVFPTVIGGGVGWSSGGTAIFGGLGSIGQSYNYGYGLKVD